MRLSAADLFAVLGAASATRVDKPWGWEVHLTTDEFILKVITVLDGHRTSLQRHEEKVEEIYVLDGTGGVAFYVLFVTGDGDRYQHVMTVRQGDSVRVEPGTIHRSIGPVTLLEVTTHPDTDVVRLEDDYARPKAL